MTRFTRFTSFHRTAIGLGLLALGLLTTAGASASASVFAPEPGVTPLELVSVGDGFNPADPLTGRGTVEMEYRIARYEVTNAQYAAFLEAVAASDPHDLYNADMAGPFGGIDRTGQPGSYAYAAQEGRENLPVTFVSIWDALRFCNWLHNGQGNGDTESGAYQLAGNTLIGGRAADAEFFLPTDAEWYKAAYYQPAAQGGDIDGYWLYPTRGNSLAGNEDLDGANYFDGDFFDGIPFEEGPLSPVGWYIEAASAYGTFDQGGNVSEWLETRVSGSNYGIRGGSWQWTPGLLQSTSQASAAPDYEDISHGFRVAARAQTTTAVEDRTPEAQRPGLAIYPNPFNPRTTVAFTMRAAGPATVEVFDTRGRLVRTLGNGLREAGEHRVTWDGRDDRGENVAAGVYLVRVTTPAGVTAGRALLVK